MRMNFQENSTLQSVSLLLVFAPFSVLATLPSSIQSAVPLCAQSCVEDILQKNFASSICSDRSDIDCLCSGYGLDGNTIGEDAYACLYSSNCSEATKSNSRSLYTLCTGKVNAVTPTHKTLVVTATFTPRTSSSSLSFESRNTLYTTSTSVTMITPTNPASSLGMSSEKSNVPLTMAQIAGITIAAAALLILAVGVATYLIFVRRNKRVGCLDDHKILLYPSPKQPWPEGSRASILRSPKNPRGGVGGVGVTDYPPSTPSEPSASNFKPQQWPRYYSVLPNEIGIARTADYPLPASVHTRALSTDKFNALNLDEQFILSHPEGHSDGIVFPKPPSAALINVPKTGTDRQIKNSRRPSRLRPTSHMTEFEEDDQLSPTRSDFAALQPANQFPFVGPQVRERIMPVFPPPSQSVRTKVVRPTLAIEIPKTEMVFPPPPPGPPPALQNLPGSRSTHKLRPGLQMKFHPSQQDPRSVKDSSSTESHKARGSKHAWKTVVGPSGTSSPPTSKNGRDSQASLTSFDSYESDEEVTPPEEEDKRLYTIKESQSPIAAISYPKVPRAANQAVARNPPSPRYSSRSNSASPDSSPRNNPYPSNLSPASRSIGNLLWRTEKSPRSEGPINPKSWVARQDDTECAPEPMLSTSVTEGDQITAQTPRSVSIAPSSSVGVMPTLTPTRRGDNLYLSVD